MHALDQLRDAAETQLRTDPIQESDVEHAAIEVARKVEQEHFQDRLTVVEHRPAAKARHALVAALADADTHGINPKFEVASRAEAQIGGRNPQFAPALVAVNDFAADEPR